MELQGNEAASATHDFLSLYKDSSSLPRHDPRGPAQGLLLKTHDFLQPLEWKRREGERPPDINVPAASPERPVERALPGGIGTYSISHVPAACSSRFGAVVKSEWGVPEAEPRAGEEPAISNASTYAGGSFALWEENLPTEKVLKGGAQEQHRSPHQWTAAAASSPFSAARSSTSSFGSLSCSRSQQGRGSRRFMDAGSNFSKGFTDDDDEDDGFGRRNGAAQNELTVRVDGKNNNEQKPSTPRSKHSATEQRRRSKINDRFQILRDLIPHNDQKRDKASFLLEVIEYIQFLQEKVQKYESEFPGWNQDATNMMPWQRNPQVPMDGVGDPSRAMKNGHAPIGFVNSVDDAVPNATAMLTNSQDPSEPENISSGIPGKATPASVPAQQIGVATGFAQPQQRLIPESDNMAYPSQSQCLRSDVGNGQILEQELTIDEGTINISSAYSQEVMNALAQSLQNSGVDTSQASISVQINLGRRAFSRPASVALEREGPCGNQMIGHSRSGSSGEEPDRANKRHKSSRN